VVKLVEVAEGFPTLISDSDFDRAVKKLKDKYMADWQVAESVETREDIHERVKVLNEVAGEIKSLIGVWKVKEHNKVRKDAVI